MAESNQIRRQHARLMISALTAVERGQDPKQVYATMLAPQNVSQAEWDSYQAQWKDPAKRVQIQQRLGVTPDGVAQGISKAMQQTALYAKLDRSVDHELAAQDPQFRTALEHWNASERINPDHSVFHGISKVEQDYLGAQRAAFWKAREAKLHVVLNDPNVAAKCGIGATK